MKLPCLFVLSIFAAAAPVTAAEPAPETAALLGRAVGATETLEWPEEDLSGRLMDGAHRFVERKIAETVAMRNRTWAEAVASAEKRGDFLEKQRRRLREIVGAAGERPTVRMERFGDDEAPALVAETAEFRVFQVRWPAVESVVAEGLLVEPIGEVKVRAVLVPDADQTPEQLLGLAEPTAPARSWGADLAAAGFQLVIPTLVTRQPLETDDPLTRKSAQTDREWIYRQAYHMGRHVIGYEVQKVLAAVDWLARQGGNGARIAVAGHGEGGMIALFAAAIDPRIHSTLVSGYFAPREGLWAEPIYRNLWSYLKDFGDAELAVLILPRTLVVEHSAVPAVHGHKGDWDTPANAAVAREFARIAAIDGVRATLVAGPDGGTVEAGSAAALEALSRGLGVPLAHGTPGGPVRDLRPGFKPDERRRRVMANLEGAVQALVEQSGHVREDAFLFKVLPDLRTWKWSTDRSLPTRAPAPFIEAAKQYREDFRVNGMGKFDEPPLPLHPRLRVFREHEKWVACDVVLDVWPEVFAWGLLVLPRDLQPGERRPVVVCQHGRDGLPRKTIDEGVTGYDRVAAKLAEEGFITFAPHNLYRGEDRYRWLNRKASGVQATLFSFILAQHDAILRWLGTLPSVDATRIGFYGLSYGGETAVRVPPLLEGYALSICAGDFNQWTRKVASTSEPFSFMRTIEWEMPYWNLGHTFDYAEMAYLMIPRPFMVERGHLDLVGRDHWVAHEFAKVRWLYSQLGLADRTGIAFFQGGHAMRADATFDFLRQHLGDRMRR